MKTLQSQMPQGVQSTEHTFNSSLERQEFYARMRCESFNNSVGNLNEYDGYDCPKCKNRGTFWAYRLTEFGYYEEYTKSCSCKKIRECIAKMKRSGLEDVIRKYTFDSFDAVEEWQKIIKSAAMRFVDDDENMMFFIGGQSGAGKTVLCTAICAEYLRRNRAVKYMVWCDEIGEIKAAVNESDKYERLIRELKTTDILYIDDFFKTGNKDGAPVEPTSADVRIAFEVINYRYLNPNLTTIISSERTINDLIDIDEALGGRIAQYTMTQGYGFSIRRDRTKNYRLKYMAEL